MTTKAETILDILIDRGIGIEDAAIRAGISPTTLRNWIYGRTVPRTATAARLAKALRVPVRRVVDAVQVERE